MAERTAPASSTLPPLFPVQAGLVSALASAENRHVQGQPCLHLRLPCGDAITVTLHGAQVVSWVAGGREQLYLSPRAAFDGASAIRGGVPVCFPQFNQCGALPKHGFARNRPWTVVPADGVACGLPPGTVAGLPAKADEVAEGAVVSLRLSDDAATRDLWPQAFEATLTVLLRPGSLQMTLAVHNTGAQPLRFTGALHTYLAVDDIAAVRLGGLQGQPCRDALTNQPAQATGDIRFDGEFDRIFVAARTPLTLKDGSRRLQIAQSASLADTVVWNPGEALCGRLADMPADGFARMLCVEAAQVMEPVTVPAGEIWQGWQRLTVL